MVADALSRKKSMVSYHRKSMGLVMVPSIFEQLWVAQSKGLKGDHVKDEIMVE